MEIETKADSRNFKNTSRQYIVLVSAHDSLKLSTKLEITLFVYKITGVSSLNINATDTVTVATAVLLVHSLNMRNVTSLKYL